MSQKMTPPVALHSTATIANHDTTNPAVTMAVNGYGRLRLVVRGTAGNALKIEPRVSMDGTNWVVLAHTNMNTNDVVNGATGIAATGVFSVDVAGFTFFRAFITGVQTSTTSISAEAVAVPV